MGTFGGNTRAGSRGAAGAAASTAVDSSSALPTGWLVGALKPARRTDALGTGGWEGRGTGVDGALLAVDGAGGGGGDEARNGSAAPWLGTGRLGAIGVSSSGALAAGRTERPALEADGRGG